MIHIMVPGSSKLLDCVISGDVDFWEWLRNGKTIEPGTPGYILYSNTSLEIRNASATLHTGMYRCKANNIFQKLSHDKTIYVYDSGEGSYLLNLIFPLPISSYLLLNANSKKYINNIKPTGIATLGLLYKRNKDMKNRPTGPTLIMKDNQSAACMARTSQFHGRDKHIETNHHFIWKQVNSIC